MTAPRWILLTLTSLLLTAALSFAFMVSTDFTGQFRDPRGRSLPIYYADRASKTLLNERYVPVNYDALLIGPSSSVNWNPDLITQGTGLRMYNESLEGGNATEEKTLVDRAFKRGRFKAALLVVYPTMVATHTVEEGMDKTKWTEALGSVDAYAETVFSEMKLHGIPFSKSDALADGSHGLHYTDTVDEDDRVRPKIDPKGLDNMRLLVQKLRQHGAGIVYVVPPLYEIVRVRSDPGVTDFANTMQQQLPPGAWINLNAPEYTTFRLDKTNFIDNYHLSAKGAETVSRILHTRLCALPQAEFPACR